MQCINAVAQCEKTPIDVGTLNHTDAPIVCFGCSLRTSQINKGELTYPELSLDSRILILMLTGYLENSMGTGRGLIGTC